MTKSTAILVRMTPEEKAAADAVARARGMTLSEVIRDSLARMARRIKTKDDA